MAIDRNVKIPLYQQVYEALKTNILSNHYGKEGFLPSERDLGDLFHVDRVTVRRALDLLVTENLVEKTANVGTKVKLPNYSGLAEKTIMFILPKRENEDERITGSFNSNLFYEVEKECKNRNCRVIYTTIKPGERLADCIMGHDIGGLLLISKNERETYIEAKQLGIPTILVNHYYPGFQCVLIDDEDGAYEATNYLIAQGHTKIAPLAGVPDYQASLQRLAGFRRAMIEAGLDFQRYPIYYAYWTFPGGYNGMKELINSLPSKELPTAVFAFNDWTAFGALQAIEESGFKVPQDISLVGFNGIDLPITAKLGLTTVKVNIKQLGRSAIEHLQKLVENNQECSLKIIVPTELIINDSVRAIG